MAYESVHFHTHDGVQLHGWFFPGQPPVRGTILHLHGNAGNITGHFEHAAWLPAKGWNVLCFDYRGYGQSAGTVTRAGTIADAHAALDYLRARPDLDPERILGFGQSLGGAVGIVLAAERPELRGLAADGAFEHYRRITSWHLRRNPLLRIVGWWVPYFMSKDYNPIDYVGRIAPRPLLIMHGTEDSIVDPAMARRLYEAAGEPKQLWMFDGADHYGALHELAETARPRLLEFFSQCLP
ncbi:MAG: alpha/beta hydrolase [Phycisphaerales bacterium]|nr:alpha/beta hydrolase [Phycisphaerales bacterium]